MSYLTDRSTWIVPMWIHSMWELGDVRENQRGSLEVSFTMLIWWSWSFLFKHIERDIVSYVPCQKGYVRAKWNHLEEGEISPSIESCWACSEVRCFQSTKWHGQESESEGEGATSRETGAPGDWETVEKYKEQIQGWP